MDGEVGSIEQLALASLPDEVIKTKLAIALIADHGRSATLSHARIVARRLPRGRRGKFAEMMLEEAEGIMKVRNARRQSRNAHKEDPLKPGEDYSRYRKSNRCSIINGVITRLTGRAHTNITNIAILGKRIVVFKARRKYDYERHEYVGWWITTIALRDTAIPLGGRFDSLDIAKRVASRYIEILNSRLRVEPTYGLYISLTGVDIRELKKEDADDRKREGEEKTSSE